MGIDYSAIVGIGREFEDKEEAVEWFEKKTGDEVKNTLRDEWSDDFTEYLTGQHPLQGELLNCYSGEGFVIYIPFEVQTVSAFEKSFNMAKEEWKKRFGEEGDVIHTVTVW